MNSEDDFRKWQYSFKLQIQQQPYYHSTQKLDPVKLELERMDKLENVVNIRDTKWVEEYCNNLLRK